jgi:kynurenine formamidase
MLVDLSHTFENGMPGFRMRMAEGKSVPFTASIRPFLTHEESKPLYANKASFEITEMSFQTSIGTYLDSPRHRFPGRRDIAQLTLDELALDGVTVHIQNARGGEPVDLAQISMPTSIRNKAVLFRFDWDKHWGTEEYYSYPYVAEDVIDHLVAEGAKLVGVDTLNADNPQNLFRPCHTKLLGNDVLIVENLMNLSALPASGFRFFAIPIKAKDTVAMPIRAFAEIQARQ